MSDMFSTEMRHEGSPIMGYLSFEQLEEYIDPGHLHPKHTPRICQSIWDTLLSKRIDQATKAIVILEHEAEVSAFMHSDEIGVIRIGELAVSCDDGLEEVINLDTVEEMISNDHLPELDMVAERILYGYIAKRRTRLMEDGPE